MKIFRLILLTSIIYTSIWEGVVYLKKTIRVVGSYQWNKKLTRPHHSHLKRIRSQIAFEILLIGKAISALIRLETMCAPMVFLFVFVGNPPDAPARLLCLLIIWLGVGFLFVLILRNRVSKGGGIFTRRKERKHIGLVSVNLHYSFFGWSFLNREVIEQIKEYCRAVFINYEIKAI